MRKSFFHCVCLTVAVIMMAACSSSRHAGKSSMIGNLEGEEYLEKFIEHAPRWKAVTGKVAFNLNMGSKGSASLSANVRMKRGEVIQLSVAPFLGIEVARMEITPDRILAVDRLHRRYVEISFETLSGMLHAELDFNALQALFFNEVFLPGEESLDVADAGRFRISSEGTQALLVPESSKAWSYQFFTGTESGLLERTRLAMEGTAYAMEWDYSDFSELDGKLFPRHILTSVEGTGGKTYSLDMRFSRMSTDAGWNTSVELSSKYQRMELQDLLDLLLKQ